MHNMHCTNKDSSQQDLCAINLASMRILRSAFCILTKDGIKWLENSTRQYLPSFEAKVQVYGVLFSCLHIKQTEKKKITLHRTFIKWLWLQSAFFAVHFVFWPKMASNGLKMRNSTRQYLPSLDAINKGGEGISMLVYVFFLGWLEKCKNAFFAQKRQHFILPIFLLVVEFEILCITTKPYILQ